MDKKKAYCNKRPSEVSDGLYIQALFFTGKLVKQSAIGKEFFHDFFP